MQLFRRHWFLASLLLSLLGGYAFSNVAQILADSSFLKWSIVFSTMFLMAWPIRFSSLRETFFQAAGTGAGQFAQYWRDSTIGLAVF
jgi:hypothetical protein